MPKFSLVIPTKNRAEILGQTLNHLLNQSFKDFECIVVNNDDTDSTAEKFYTSNLPSNFKHYRTGGLSMPDNWQTAVDQASGEYIIVLEDKTIIKYNLLAILNYILTAKPDCNCITWNQSVAKFDLLNNEMLALSQPKISEVLCDDLINMIARSMWTSFAIFAPRGFNCVLRSSFAHGDLCEISPFRLCRPISPDYSIAFQYSALNKSLIHLDDPCTIINASAPSNGLEGHRKGALFRNFLSELGMDECQYYEFAPSKVFSVHNSLTSDAIKMLSEFQKTKKFQISLPEYYVNISYETIFRKFLGCDIESDVEQFNREFKNFDQDIKSKTLEYLKSHHIEFCNRWGLPPIYHAALEMHISLFFD